jgi:ribosomal protein S27AE
MAIKAIMLRGDFTPDEFSRIVALVRQIDTVPGRLVRIMAIDPDTSLDEARAMVDSALPSMPGRDSTAAVVRGGRDRLTDQQIDTIESGFCPDCGRTAAFMLGPRGGMSQNHACSQCGAEFCLAQHGGLIVWGHRVSPRYQPDRERLHRVYGIEL